MSVVEREKFHHAGAERGAAPDSAPQNIRGGAALRSGVGALLPLLLLVAFAGCVGSPQRPSATQPVTVTDPQTTQPSYWYDEPSPVAIEGDNFDKLWRAAEDAIRYHGFKIDREDRRQGLLTSEPMVSSQFFEPWHRDVLTIGDSARASLATTRRTLRFEFARSVDGTWEVTPKVLVEREAVGEHRITSVTLYRGAVTGSCVAAGGRDTPRGTREADEGLIVPPRYWYAIGRDPALEKSIARVMREHLANKS